MADRTRLVSRRAEADRGTCDCFTADDVLTRSGMAVTYRQLDYWTRQGFVTAHTHGIPPGRDSGAAPGSGRGRTWARREADWAAFMGQAMRAMTERVGTGPTNSAWPALLSQLFEGSIHMDLGVGRLRMELERWATDEIHP